MTVSMQVSIESELDVTAIFDLVTEGEETDVAGDKDDLIGEAAAAEHSSSLGGR
jgi:hypothetical protein